MAIKNMAATALFAAAALALCSMPSSRSPPNAVVAQSHEVASAIGLREDRISRAHGESATRRRLRHRPLENSSENKPRIMHSVEQNQQPQHHYHEKQHRQQQEQSSPPCFSIGWHVEMIHRDGCTNDDNYEDDWAKPGIKEMFIFSTSEECCARFFNGRGDDQKCKVYESGCQFQDPGDAIENTDCDSPWHPNFKAKMGCSNDDDETSMPEGWTEVFDSAKACCEVYSDRNGVCPVYDKCSVTKGTTYLAGPHPPPTKAPTHAPTTHEEWQRTYYNPPIDSSMKGSIDFFLLSGQSNMHGHVTTGYSIGGNDTYWMKVKSILDSGGEAGVMADALYDAIYEANSGLATVASTLTGEMMSLYNAGLLRQLDVPLRLGSCSFLEPMGLYKMKDRSNGTQPTVWNANCGGVFGPELMFSRALEMELGQTNAFEAVKNAGDGSNIYRHWYPGHGRYWEKLRSSIRSRKGYGNWKAFIWHQGIQDSIVDHRYDGNTAPTYFGNLTGLVEQVRLEMFDASEAGTWQCKEQIPVVIVQIGDYPHSPEGTLVREAQARYCDGDPRAELVTTKDLSHFYHLDGPSLLIEGYRIAQAYQTAVRGDVTCSSTINPESSSSSAAPILQNSASEESSLASPAPSPDSTSEWEDQS